MVVGATGNVRTSVVEALGADPDVRSIVGVTRRLPWRTNVLRSTRVFEAAVRAGVGLRAGVGKRP